ncbi:type I restriction enzyme endonuclease domain-containing protein [Corynebacterium phoceense]|uniref:type I restriction enzyme endonuclease domain-containing protein n=1 Tax=Corynebacterium phoceense TaxID=1686286 RepID=UPI003B8A6152
MDDEALAEIARQLVATLRRSVRRLLRDYKYPPDKAPEAIKLVIEQMEKFAPRYSAQAREHDEF